MKDIDDNIYLDFGSGIAVANIGHRHPKVTAAIIEQAQKCDHVNSCDYFTVPQVEFAEKLSRVMPWKGSKRFFFGNSGSEAVEGALKAARMFTGKKRFIATVGGFHGKSMGSLLSLIHI